MRGLSPATRIVSSYLQRYETDHMTLCACVADQHRVLCQAHVLHHGNASSVTGGSAGRAVSFIQRYSPVRGARLTGSETAALPGTPAQTSRTSRARR